MQYIVTKTMTIFMIFVMVIKQLLDEVFVICRIINVEVRVISRAEGEADNSFRDIDNFAYHQKPSPIIVLLYIFSGKN